MITGAASSVARYVAINRASRIADLSVVIKEGASDIIQRTICGTPTCSMNLTLVGYRTSLQADGGNSGTKGLTSRRFVPTNRIRDVPLGNMVVVCLPKTSLFNTLIHIERG